MGEDFLDLAVVEPRRAALMAARVDLRGIGGAERHASAARGAIEELARRIAKASPELRAGAIALVDSPRWPRDMDLSRPGEFRGEVRERSIDGALRAMARGMIDSGAGTARPLALFPTPRRAYFDACLEAPACKPHLRAMGAELFAHRRRVPLHGGTFTRFMIAGFAAYRALAAMGVDSYEAYPDLQFRLWSRGATLPPKKSGAKAREQRRRIVAAVADRIEVSGCEALDRLDALDAAILALTAAAARRAGVVVILEHRAEGRFMVAMDASREGRRRRGG